MGDYSCPSVIMHGCSYGYVRRREEPKSKEERGITLPNTYPTSP